jgi:hypothetical protein
MDRSSPYMDTNLSEVISYLEDFGDVERSYFEWMVKEILTLREQVANMSE